MLGTGYFGIGDGAARHPRKTLRKQPGLGHRAQSVTIPVYDQKGRGARVHARVRQLLQRR
jgi:hypothetical protein